MRRTIVFKQICLVCLILALVFMESNLLAQAEAEDTDFLENKTKEEDKDKTTIKLDRVVVSATRTEERLKDIPINIELIDTKEIEEIGAISVGDIFGQKVTGHYHRYTGLLQPIGMRGFRTESHGDDIKGYVLILVDGHRIGTGNMGKIPPEMIERIEIIKGPASALYGSAAMGGVVNIITKRGKGKLENSLKCEYGSFDFMRGAAASGGSITDWFSCFVSASYMHVDDFITKTMAKHTTAMKSMCKQEVI